MKNHISTAEPESYTVTENPCVVCAPLGAVLAFAGIRRSMSILHGSQGCATYIRRYMISHFREALDTASTSFSEEHAVFGGAAQLRLACENVSCQYVPDFIGIASTCLAETIGEDARFIQDILGTTRYAQKMQTSVSTASYKGDQRDGFYAALKALTVQACTGSWTADTDDSNSSLETVPDLALAPAMLSPEDLRWIKKTVQAFGLKLLLLTDYSQTLDGAPGHRIDMLPEGGTPVEQLKHLKHIPLFIELGEGYEDSAGTWLEKSYKRHVVRHPLPIGIRQTDSFLRVLSRESGSEIPPEFREQRGRLLDSYIDAHKIISGKKALLYGDPDMTTALACFFRECGMQVDAVSERDFVNVEKLACTADLLVGSSKGYKLAKKLGIPLLRLGFPVHDRFGAQRLACLGYSGSQQLFDRIVNVFLEKAQEESDVGYTYF